MIYSDYLYMNKSFECLVFHIYIYIPYDSFLLYKYIVIHRQIDSLYHNSSVWLDMQVTSSWDRAYGTLNPADDKPLSQTVNQRQFENSTHMY